MTKAMGKEYAETGITVNAIAPAVVRTAMVDAMPATQVSRSTPACVWPVGVSVTSLEVFAQSLLFPTCVRVRGCVWRCGSVFYCVRECVCACAWECCECHACLLSCVGVLCVELYALEWVSLAELPVA